MTLLVNLAKGYIHCLKQMATAQLPYAGVKLSNGQSIGSDLTIDASGKSSKVPSWLKQIGHRPPHTLSVRAGVKYTYRLYERPKSWPWALAKSMNNPDNNKVALVVPIENNKWQAGCPDSNNSLATIPSSS